MLKLGFVIGTRPETIKCALPIIEIRKDERFDPILISTGQHDEMLYSTLSVAAADFNQDGKLDFATIAYSVPNHFVAKQARIVVHLNQIK
ncbi:FG-GAP repeat protein [Xenorhabdus bovienii]|uniref:UDP-N-acetylglucosamine 2-epimerase n=1 Tax=Xenorhabdus bovienii TaxID=40576 RepID=A0A0B6XFU1_XENBV|nr:FG-GAP repeat protein [Xenorhabdus bovienii]CDG87512.1 conserved hypothetical protein [Xenorhabdus bovienii str. feltiae France]CDG94108.1 conserved hypothetical protein [Xenorhabdus bovienii str. feltiae Florida]CDM91748.1 conserved protein of unknown function [Xenorhabdus bovienii]